MFDSLSLPWVGGPHGVADEAALKTGLVPEDCPPDRLEKLLDAGLSEWQAARVIPSLRNEDSLRIMFDRCRGNRSALMVLVDNRFAEQVVLDNVEAFRGLAGPSPSGGSMSPHQWVEAIKAGEDLRALAEKYPGSYRMSSWAPMALDDWDLYFDTMVKIGVPLASFVHAPRGDRTARCFHEAARRFVSLQGQQFECVRPFFESPAWTSADFADAQRRRNFPRIEVHSGIQMDRWVSFTNYQPATVEEVGYDYSIFGDAEGLVLEPSEALLRSPALRDAVGQRNLGLRCHRHTDRLVETAVSWARELRSSPSVDYDALAELCGDFLQEGEPQLTEFEVAMRSSRELRDEIFGRIRDDLLAGSPFGYCTLRRLEQYWATELDQVAFECAAEMQVTPDLLRSLLHYRRTGGVLYMALEPRILAGDVVGPWEQVGWVALQLAMFTESSAFDEIADRLLSGGCDVSKLEQLGGATLSKIADNSRLLNEKLLPLLVDQPLSGGYLTSHVLDTGLTETLLRAGALAGEALLPVAQKCPQLFTDLLWEEFGDNAPQWRLARTLFDDWGGTLPELVALVKDLT